MYCVFFLIFFNGLIKKQQLARVFCFFNSPEYFQVGTWHIMNYLGELYVVVENHRQMQSSMTVFNYVCYKTDLKAGIIDHNSSQ